MSALERLPFRFRRTRKGELFAISIAGDYCFLSDVTLQTLFSDPEALPLRVKAELQSKFFLIREGAAGTRRLLASRIAARHRTITSEPSLFIVVPTLQCEHSCRYCQVSRSLADHGVSLSGHHVDQICKTIAESGAEQITVEFQGGDPLLRFDLIRRGIEGVASTIAHRERVSFVVASTLHQLTPEMCGFLREYNVQLSTSIDGPEWLHNKVRPLPTRDSHSRTIRGIDLARRLVGSDSVAALATITTASLNHGAEIVSEYVRLGLTEVSFRPVSPYGFAVRHKNPISPTISQYSDFYDDSLGAVIETNRKGIHLREGQASIVLNKLLSPIDRGYVDLQCSPGGGTATLVFNYDGFVYPSDESRMLAESGDKSLRIGTIGESLVDLKASTRLREYISAGQSLKTPGCDECVYGYFCGPDVTQSRSLFGSDEAPSAWTQHCKSTMWLFDYFLDRLRTADTYEQNLFRNWSATTS